MLDQQGKLLETQNQLSTGKRLLSPSDDPVGAVRSLELQRALAKTDQTDSNWLYQTGIPRVSCACYRCTTTPN